MSAPRLLVTGVGSNIGQGIVKAVRRRYPDAFFCGVDAVAGNPGFHACAASAVVPRADDAGYLDAVADLIRAHRIELVLVGSNAEPRALAGAGDLGAEVVVCTPETVALCGDKHETARFLADRGRAAPRSAIDLAAADAIGFPLVVKPRGGNASVGVSVCRDPGELRAAFAALEDPVAQKLVGDPGDEYTVAAVGDREGRVAAVLAMRRRLAAGTTVEAEIASFPEIEREARAVAELLAPRGPINIQMRRDGDRAVTFEVNARFSGTTALRALAGWNDAAATVAHFLYGEPIALERPPDGTVRRYYDEVFVGAGGEVCWQSLEP